MELLNKVKIDNSDLVMHPNQVSERLFGTKNRLMRYWTMRTYLLELLARLIEIGENASEDVSAATETLSQLSSAISKDGISADLLSAHMLVLVNVQNRQNLILGCFSGSFDFGLESCMVKGI